MIPSVPLPQECHYMCFCTNAEHILRELCPRHRRFGPTWEPNTGHADRSLCAYRTGALSAQDVRQAERAPSNRQELQEAYESFKMHKGRGTGRLLR